MSESMAHQNLSKVILKDQNNGHSTGKCETCICHTVSHSDTMFEQAAKSSFLLL